MSGPPEILLFFGRFHLLLVHLPIGLVVLLAAMELTTCFPRFKQANGNAGFVLALAVPAALGAALCGWLLALGGGYDAGLLRWHRWMGIGTAAACVAAALFYSKGWLAAYRWCLGSALAALVLASHFGGSLTHGRGYLVRYAPGPLRSWSGPPAGASALPAERKNQAVADTDIFTGAIAPLLHRDCVVCHGPEKTKAGLRLDSLAALLKGGDSGPSIVPGKSAESLLIRRLRLPADSEDHMPPAGKPQPGPEEIALLAWWIDSGAPAERKIGVMNPPPDITRLLESSLGSQARGGTAPK